MNKAIIKAVFELEAQLITGLINKQTFDKELDNFLEMVSDSKTKEFILSHKDRDI